MELISLEKIRFAYPNRPESLRGLDFSLNEGDRLGITGPNGAGKSTMLKLAMGLMRPLSGTVRCLGMECLKEKDFRKVRKKVGFVFQDSDDQLFCPTVLEDVAFGPLNLGLGHEKSLEEARWALSLMGLSDYEDRLSYQLSGGEKKLVCLASVLAMRPRAVLLDEPSAGLDEKHAARLEDALLNSDLAWATVSHDGDFLARTCHKVLTLKDGVISDQAGA